MNKETGGPEVFGQANEAPKPMTAEEFIAAVTKQTKPTEDEKLEYLRDHFAGLAMQAIVSNSVEVNPAFDAVAEDAYMQADAMLKARKQ